MRRQALVLLRLFTRIKEQRLCHENRAAFLIIKPKNITQEYSRPDYLLSSSVTLFRLSINSIANDIIIQKNNENITILVIIKAESIL